MPYVYSETNEWSKDWLSKGMSAALVCNNFSPIPLKISFHIEKSDLSLQEIYKALKPFWLYKWVRVSRVVARFPQASGSLPAATAADLDTPCQTVFVLASQTSQSRAGERPPDQRVVKVLCAPKSQQVWSLNSF